MNPIAKTVSSVRRRQPWTRRVRTSILTPAPPKSSTAAFEQPVPRHPMTLSDEAAFAWALAAEARHVLSRVQRSWICVTIGTGDYSDAIEDLLCAVVAHGVVLPSDLAETALNWLVGFRGTATESRLRQLITTAIAPEYFSSH